jgi:uncharacterized protein (DUF849 family)
MPERVIVTCAPTGAIHTPTMSPHLSVTPVEIAQTSVEAAMLGGNLRVGMEDSLFTGPHGGHARPGAGAARAEGSRPCHSLRCRGGRCSG